MDPITDFYVYRSPRFQRNDLGKIMIFPAPLVRNPECFTLLSLIFDYKEKYLQENMHYEKRRFDSKNRIFALVIKIINNHKKLKKCLPFSGSVSYSETSPFQAQQTPFPLCGHPRKLVKYPKVSREVIWTTKLIISFYWGLK